MTKGKNYKSLRNELDEIMNWFNNSDLDIDEAIEKYQQAIKVTSEIEDYLKTAQNKITKISKL